MTGKDAATICSELGGKGFGALKEALTDAHRETIVPIGKRMADFLADGIAVSETLARGAARANEVAVLTMREVHEIVGFG